VPFLARHLSDALGPAALPDSLCNLLGIQSAPPSALTRDAMHRLPLDSSTLEEVANQVVAMAKTRIDELLETPLVLRPLPANLEDALRLWPTRPRNVLQRSGLSTHPSRLRRVTLGNLLEVRSAGLRTAMSVASLLETSGVIDSEASRVASRPQNRR